MSYFDAATWSEGMAVKYDIPLSEVRKAIVRLKFKPVLIVAAMRVHKRDNILMADAVEAILVAERLTEERLRIGTVSITTGNNYVEVWDGREWIRRG